MSGPADITSVGIYATRYSRDVMGLPGHGELPGCSSSPLYPCLEKDLQGPPQFHCRRALRFFSISDARFLPAKNITTSFDLAPAFFAVGSVLFNYTFYIRARGFTVVDSFTVVESTGIVDSIGANGRPLQGKWLPAFSEPLQNMWRCDLWNITPNWWGVMLITVIGYQTGRRNIC
ncbi:hypothetical protein RF240_09895 [Dickeya dadantii]